MTRIALTPDPKWAATLPEVADAATAAGFEALGLGPHWLAREDREAFLATGVACHEVVGLTPGADEVTALDHAERVAEAAAQLGAEWVVTAFLEPITATTRSIAARAALLFAETGVGMAVEFTPTGPVPGIADALEIVGDAERHGGRAGLLIDTWHFCLGPSTWADLEALPLDAIAYVQFDDALAPTGEHSIMAETLHRRALPGDGTLELRRFADTLLDRGWSGTVSVEVLSASLRELDVATLATRLYESTAPFWTA